MYEFNMYTFDIKKLYVEFTWVLDCWLYFSAQQL